MLMNLVNQVTTKFYTVRYLTGKDKQYQTEIIEAFVTLAEAQEFRKKDAFSKDDSSYLIRHEHLKASIKFE